MGFLLAIQDAWQGKPVAARSSLWPALAKKWVKAHGLCSACGTSAKLEVHHLKPVHLFPELELDEGNLITLCRAHHFLVGHLGAWESFNPTCIIDASWWLGKVRSRPQGPTWLA